MVVDIQIHNVLRRLERYFIRLNNFQLNGANYDLILVEPADSSYISKYTWIISSLYIDKKPQKDVIGEILNDFKNSLSHDDFISVSRISIISCNTPLVKNLKFMFPYKNEVIELSNTSVGGREFDHAFILKSHLLEILRIGNSVRIQTTKEEIITAVLISIDEDYKIKFYTSKALREFFRPDRTYKENSDEITNHPEQYLLANKYIDFIHLDEIFQIK